MAQILDGLKVSKEIKAEIKADVEKLLQAAKEHLISAAILVGKQRRERNLRCQQNKKTVKEVGFTSSFLQIFEHRF